jgi:hypothetical protein
MRYFYLFCLVLSLKIAHSQDITVIIDPTQAVKNISSALYGRNNSIPKESFAQPLAAADLLRLKDAGVRFIREGGGNNSTKYNWRKRLSSHPDWYNNVYVNNWDGAVQKMVNDLPNAVNGMWTFQLIGKVADVETNNFKDWDYNKSQWWSGVHQNLAGGGTVNTTGGNTALTNGNPNLYLKEWNADSTVGILDHWFNTLNIPKNRVQYWNMDNEPEIWHGTHDDIVSSTLPAETFMQSYFAVAKKARAKYPAIKLVGPVPANEWQWYNWMNRSTTMNGQYYCWLEYFIKRCAEEQTRSGVRLLDVLDIHFYPSESTPEQVVQLHRVFFDRNYVYSGANGVKNVGSSWDNSQTKEYIFARINDWLNQYFGQNHGIKLGLTEMDVSNNTPSVVATWYASMLGEFMKNEVEIFTPWSWKVGMWEVLHLFSRYNFTQSLQGISSDETFVSAYPSLNSKKDSMTVVLVNRSTTATKSTTVNFNNFNVLSTSTEGHLLSNLPTTETFVSHTQNAIQNSAVNIANNSMTVSLPPLSILSLTVSGVIKTTSIASVDIKSIILSPNPTKGLITIENGEKIEKIEVYDIHGRLQLPFSNKDFRQIDISDLAEGLYMIVLHTKEGSVVRKVVKW